MSSDLWCHVVFEYFDILPVKKNSCAGISVGDVCRCAVCGGVDVNVDGVYMMLGARRRGTT